MNNLVDILSKSFNAGGDWASACGQRHYAPNFKEWYEIHKKEIEQLHRLLMLSDGHRQYRRNDGGIYDDMPGGKYGHVKKEIR